MVKGWDLGLPLQAFWSRLINHTFRMASLNTNQRRDLKIIYLQFIGLHRETVSELFFSIYSRHDASALLHFLFFLMHRFGYRFDLSAAPFVLFPGYFFNFVRAVLTPFVALQCHPGQCCLPCNGLMNAGVMLTPSIAPNYRLIRMNSFFW